MFRFPNIRYLLLLHLRLEDHHLQLDDDDHRHSLGHHLDHLDEDLRVGQAEDDHLRLPGENQVTVHEEEGADLKVAEVDLIMEEVEVDMVDLKVEEAVMEMMVEEVDMEVEEDMAIEEVTEAGADQVGMVVEEDMVHRVEVDHPQEEEDMVRDQDQGRGQGRDHQFEEQEEGIVRNMVERGDILRPGRGRSLVGVEVGVLHQGGRRALVGVSAGREVQWEGRGVIQEVSVGVKAGVGAGPLCLRSRSSRKGYSKGRSWTTGRQ